MYINEQHNVDNDEKNNIKKIKCCISRQIKDDWRLCYLDTIEKDLY
jgi:hypothetical protein